MNMLNGLLRLLSIFWQLAPCVLFVCDRLGFCFILYCRCVETKKKDLLPWLRPPACTMCTLVFNFMSVLCNCLRQLEPRLLYKEILRELLPLWLKFVSLHRTGCQ